MFRARVVALLCGPLLCGPLLCGWGAAPAWADAPPAPSPAVLKIRIQLDAAVITVADLWSGSGAKADAVVGPAPPPGRTITVEAAQLAYIAKLFDVDWRPVSGVERASIERLGRALTRDEITDPLRRGLIDAGAPANTSVELSNFTPVQVPPLAVPGIAIEGLSYDQSGERFVAAIAVAGDGMETQHMRLTGRVAQMTAAVVANRRLRPGEIIGQADVRAAQVAERRLASPVLADIALVIGQSAKRVIVAGQPLAAGDIGPPVLIAKGDTVVMVVDTPNMYLAVQGLALGQGGRDDVIQVMNPLSRVVVAARVTGPGRAVITPGGAPLVAASAARPRNPEIAE